MDLRLLGGVEATAHRFVWLPGERTAILSDVHLGAAASLAAGGLYVPEVGRAELERAWEAVVEREPARVVIAGDLFDRPKPEEDARDFFGDLIGRLAVGCEVVVTRGNHDPVALEKWVPGRCKVVDSVSVGGVVVSHGHERLAKMPGVWVVGHQHPAVVLSTRVQSAKMACYAVCEVGETKLIVMPAFSRSPLGGNLLTGRNWLLPVARPTAGRVRIYGLIEPAAPREGQVLDFGWLSELK